MFYEIIQFSNEIWFSMWIFLIWVLTFLVIFLILNIFEKFKVHSIFYFIFIVIISILFYKWNMFFLKNIEINNQNEIWFQKKIDIKEWNTNIEEKQNLYLEEENEEVYKDTYFEWIDIEKNRQKFSQKIFNIVEKEYINQYIEKNSNKYLLEIWKVKKDIELLLDIVSEYWTIIDDWQLFTISLNCFKQKTAWNVFIYNEPIKDCIDFISYLKFRWYWWTIEENYTLTEWWKMFWNKINETLLK